MDHAPAVFSCFSFVHTPIKQREKRGADQKKQAPMKMKIHRPASGSGAAPKQQLAFGLLAASLSLPLHHTHLHTPQHTSDARRRLETCDHPTKRAFKYQETGR